LVIIEDTATYFPFFLRNFVIKGYGFLMPLQLEKKKTECVVKTHDRSETFVLQGNIVIIHQSLLNSILTTKLYILMKKINYKQR
jgi:hypothetical protein